MIYRLQLFLRSLSVNYGSVYKRCSIWKQGDWRCCYWSQNRLYWWDGAEYRIQLIVKPYELYHAYTIQYNAFYAAGACLRYALLVCCSSSRAWWWMCRTETLPSCLVHDWWDSLPRTPPAQSTPAPWRWWGAPPAEHLNTERRPSFTLKGGVCFFQKLSRGRVPKQTCSQSAVRGVYSWCEERELSAQEIAANLKVKVKCAWCF